MCCEEEKVMDVESKVGPNDGSVRGWRIWYDDGRSFWAAAPSHNVLGEKVFFEETYAISPYFK